MVFTLRSSYDSSELFNTKEQPYPLFRSLTNWDVNLRKKFWEFWKVIMTPDDADDDIAAAVRSTQAAAVLPFDFDTYDDGTPILTKMEHGKEMDLPRKQEVVRQYMRIHYRTFRDIRSASYGELTVCKEFANGRMVKSVPWKALVESPERFFAPEMLPPPEKFTWTDPVHIRDSAIKEFFDHIIKMESTENEDPDEEPQRFRFSHYKTTVAGVDQWLPAVYPEHLEELQPRRRAKAAVRGPALLTSPDDDHIAPKSPAKPSEKSPVSTRTRAMFQPTRQHMHALNVAARETSRRHTKAAKDAAKKANKKDKKKGKKKTKDLDDEEWDTDDETPDEDTHMSDLELQRLGASDEDLDMLGSDNDVPFEPPAHRTRSANDRVGKGKQRAESPPDYEPAPILSVSSTGYLAPCSVGASGLARFEYLRALSSHAEYQKLLGRWRSKVCCTLSSLAKIYSDSNCVSSWSRLLSAIHRRTSNGCRGPTRLHTSRRPCTCRRNRHKFSSIGCVGAFRPLHQWPRCNAMPWGWGLRSAIYTPPSSARTKMETCRKAYPSS